MLPVLVVVKVQTLDDLLDSSSSNGYDPLLLAREIEMAGRYLHFNAVSYWTPVSRRPPIATEIGLVWISSQERAHTVRRTRKGSDRE